MCKQSGIIVDWDSRPIVACFLVIVHSLGECKQQLKEHFKLIYTRGLVARSHLYKVVIKAHCHLFGERCWGEWEVYIKDVFLVNAKGNTHAEIFCFLARVTSFLVCFLCTATTREIVDHRRGWLN